MFRVLACAVLSMLAVVASAQTSTSSPSTAPESQPFLIGADWPADASADVEKRAAEMGLNFARITGGGYAWAIDSHAKKCKQLEDKGVHVLLQLGSHYPSADYFKYKDAYFVDHAGGTGKEDRSAWAIKYGNDAWPQYSMSASAEFRTQMAGDFAKYLAAFKDRRNVMGVILHNEPGLFWQADKLYDYNPRMLSAYTQWLRGCFASVKSLNARWGASYRTFEEIKPPAKLPPIKDPVELANMLDWRRFQTAAISRWLTWEAKGFGPGLPPYHVTTNLAGPLDAWHFHRCDDMYEFSRKMDAVGVDIYPTQWTRKLFGEYTMAMSRTTANLRPVWVCECQVYDGVSKDLTPEQRGELLYRDLWTYAAGGAKAIAMWRLTGNDGHCLTRGEANPRTEAVRSFATQAKRLRLERFNPAPREIAVVVDPDSMLYAGATSDKPLSKTSGVNNNWQGYYAAVRALGLDADVVFAQQLRELAFQQYKVLIMVSNPVMDEDLARALTAFVQAGGVLIVDEDFARVDRWGKGFGTVPGLGLDKVASSQPAAGGPKAVEFGKGRTFTLARNLGQGFLEGWGRQPLVGAVREALPEAPVTVTRSRQLESLPVDATATVLADGERRLVVLTLNNEQVKPLKEEKGLVVRLRGVAQKPKSVVLLSQDGKPSTPASEWKDGVLTVYVDVVKSACAIGVGEELDPQATPKTPTQPVKQAAPDAKR